jgi:hypothetical protein
VEATKAGTIARYVDESLDTTASALGRAAYVKVIGLVDDPTSEVMGRPAWVEVREGMWWR